MRDASNAETYMKWYFNYLQVIVEKKFNEKLLACTETLKRALEDLMKPSKVPKRESADQAAERELELAACKLKSDAAHTKHAKAIGVHYDLFRQLLADEPKFNGIAPLRMSITRTPGQDWMVFDIGHYIW